MSSPEGPSLDSVLSAASVPKDPTRRRVLGKIAIRIDREGRWFYRETPIERETMVRLFASMLQSVDGCFVLDTPDQILRIEVDDAPFVIVDADIENPGVAQIVWLKTNLGDRYMLCPDHQLQLRSDSDSTERRAYTSVERGLPALIHRNVFYRLVELAEIDAPTGRHGIRSAGNFYPLE